MLTLADVQNTQFQQATGFCTDRQEFLDLLELAVDVLIKRGDWNETVVPIRVCVKNGCVTWPRYVDTVRKLNSCTASIPVHNVWYQFLEHGHAQGVGAWYDTWSGRGGCINLGQMNFQFRAPTYNDPYGTDCYLRVYPAAAEDVGKTIQVFGLDGNGQPLMTHNSDGTWSAGITITIGNPYGSSAVVVTKIDRVVKPVTENALRLYAYDSVNDWLFDLAIYEPSETNPSYARYQLWAGEPWNYQTCQSCQSCQKTVVALVKLKQLPIKTATDLILVDDKRALLNALRALKSEEAGNIQQAQGQLQVGIESMNRALENASPDAQFSARNNVFGGRKFRNKCF